MPSNADSFMESHEELVKLARKVAYPDNPTDFGPMVEYMGTLTQLFGNTLAAFILSIPISNNKVEFVEGYLDMVKANILSKIEKDRSSKIN